MRPVASLLLVCVLGTQVIASDDVRALIEAGHWKQARAALEPRVKSNPSDAEAAAYLGYVRQAYGDLDGALKLAEAAVKLNPKNAECHWILAQVLGEQAQKANMLRQFGLARRFKSEAETAIALDPKHIDAREALISFHVRAPGLVGGDKKKAEQMAEEIAQIDPAAGYLARVRVLRETKTDGDFEGLFRKAAEAAKSVEVRYEATVGLANIYFGANPPKWDAAEEQARALVKIDPKRIIGYRALAIVFANARKWTELDAVLAEAEKAVPDNLTPYFQAGRIIGLQATPEFARAERYLRKYLTQEPEPGTPTWAHAHWRLGLLLEKQGKKVDAIAELDQAIKLKPDLEDAKKDLKRLRSS